MQAGGDERKVDFYLDTSDTSFKRIGRVSTWAWPFPEGRTVAEKLSISGRSRVAMGTAPDVWNVVMGGLVKVVPRRCVSMFVISSVSEYLSRPAHAERSFFQDSFWEDPRDVIYGHRSRVSFMVMKSSDS